MDSSARKLRVAVLVGRRGRGSNMEALAKAFPPNASSDQPAEVALVVAPSAESPALEKARLLELETKVLDDRQPDFGSSLAKALEESQIDVLCLAGYMRLIPEDFLQTFTGAILNIHPSLLPKFGGKGMYGVAVHEAVLAAGETETGCSVHFVTERYDEGAVLLQKTCPVLADDTPETLAARVLNLEHEAYPEAVQLLALRFDRH
ncbi:MAG: phosphoribosylglycinamide formyltransferase [Fimbriimonadaceae bacterium]